MKAAMQLKIKLHKKYLDKTSSGMIHFFLLNKLLITHFKTIFSNNLLYSLLNDKKCFFRNWCTKNR